MSTTDILLGLSLALTVFAVYQLLRAIRGLKARPAAYVKAVGRRMMLTTLVFLFVPVLIVLGRNNWGEMTSLYAFLAGLVTVNAIWLRDIR